MSIVQFLDALLSGALGVGFTPWVFDSAFLFLVLLQPG
jgi:hypothetical protein